MNKKIISLFFLIFITYPSLVLGNTYHITGPIDFSVRDFIIDNIDDIDIIYLNSPGGILEAGLQIGELISSRDIYTVIPPYSYCASACTIVFQAGKKRLMFETSYLLYHGASLSAEGILQYTEKCIYPWNISCEEDLNKDIDWLEKNTNLMFSFLEEHGLSIEVYNRVQRELIDNRYWMIQGNFLQYPDIVVSASEALEYNAATIIIN